MSHDGRSERSRRRRAIFTGVPGNFLLDAAACPSAGYIVYGCASQIDLSLLAARRTIMIICRGFSFALYLPVMTVAGGSSEIRGRLNFVK